MPEPRIRTKNAANHGGARPGSGPKKAGTPEAEAQQDYNKARTANEYWKAQLNEQEFRRKEGELLDRGQVEQGQAMLFASIAQTLRSFPDNLERTVGLTPEQSEALDKMIDGLCLTLIDKVKAFAEGTA